jgi:uncharacterized protein (DUF927 family)
MTKNYKRDYFEEAHAILNSQCPRKYIENLLPVGKWEGNEYVVKNPTRNDIKAGSFKINKNGKWSDFATNKSGNDLIGLTAYRKGISGVEACFYIGVPRPNEVSNNNALPAVIKHYAQPEFKIEGNHPKNTLKTTDNDILELEQQAIEEENKPAREEENKLTLITDVELPYTSQVPEFTQKDLGRRTADRFKGGKISYYNYYSSKGVLVACVVRCDKNIEGDEVKSFAQYSFDRIKRKWQASWSGDGKPLYNLPEIAKRPDVPVMIVEGEKTAEAARLLFPSYVVTTCSMGAVSPRSSNWSFLKNRDVIISPDNDVAGSKHLQKIEDILTRVGAKSIRGFDVKKLGRYTIVNGELKERGGQVPEKYDLADNANDGWKAELIDKYKEHENFTPFFEVIKDVRAIRDLLKDGEECFCITGLNYKLSKKDNSLWWEQEKTDIQGDITRTWLPLAGYIKPTYCMEDANGDHGLLAEITTRKNKTVECFFSRDEIATEKDAVKILLLKGLVIPSIKPDRIYALNNYLNNFKPEFEAVGVDKVGWQGDNETYILPIVGEVRNSYQVKKEDKPTEYILQQKGSISRELHKKGTLKEWQRTVGAVTRGNHLHTFAILAALTAPILKLLNEEGGFFHYVGSTSIGKSTIMRVALSVWGDKEMGTFKATDNNLEGVCKISNDGAMFLDEMGECEADALSRIVYMVANGVTKGRADRNGNPRPVTHFTVLAQSTGEMGIEAKLAEKRIEAKGGQLLRMGELDADRGKGLNTFDVLNINPDSGKKFEDGKAQAEYLKTYAKENCGLVIDEFMQELVKDIEAYTRGLKNFKAQWIASLNITSNQVEIDRMIKRFSTIYATGIVAFNIGIIPHTSTEIKACIDAMFQNWLERRGGDTPHEFKTMEDNLYKLCKENQYSRFKNAKPKGDERIDNPKDMAGYWKDTNEGEGDVKTEFWIFPKVFDKEILQGRDKNSFLPLLVKNGYLTKDKKNYTQIRRAQGSDSQRFYIISAGALNGEMEKDKKVTEEVEKYGVFPPAKI